MAGSEFTFAAMFSADDETVQAYNVPLASDLLGDVRRELSRQYKNLSRLQPESFNYNSYKKEDDEIYVIADYSDPDESFKAFLKLSEGKTSESLRAVDDLSTCRALFFKLPEYKNLILIQRFGNAYLARSDRWLGIYKGDTLRRIERSAFTLASSLCGYYDIEEKKLYIKSLQSIRYALPGFAKEYIPSADVVMMEKFFKNSCFDQENAKEICALKSRKIEQLIWLLNYNNINPNKKLSKFEVLDRKLNLQSYKEGKIFLSKKIRKASIALRILLGDVFEENGKIYYANSKKVIEPFD